MRCCSNDGTTCKTQKGACPGESTYSEAFEKCSDIGMRLCTKTELLSEMCCKTGGWCDSVTSRVHSHIHFLFEILTTTNFVF